MKTALCALVLPLLFAACRPGPVLTSPEPHAEGTIVGRVLRLPGSVPVADRVVVAKCVDDGEEVETRTSESGGYTLGLTPGRYELRLKFELMDTVVQQPSIVVLEPSEIERDRDFILRSNVASLQ